jgi:hypothetical protein
VDELYIPEDDVGSSKHLHLCSFHIHPQEIRVFPLLEIGIEGDGPDECLLLDDLPTPPGMAGLIL